MALDDPATNESAGSTRPLAGRVAFVTGGGRGIGQGCVMALARAGADVALTWRKDQEAAAETAAAVRALGRRALTIPCDVADEAQVEAAMRAALEEFGRVDVLVANAGIASRGGTVAETTTKEMRLLLETHVMGAFWCARAALPSMRATGRGHVFLLSSIATKGLAERTAPYTMAKCAVEALAVILSKEEGPNGVRVNCIAPGLIETEMGKRLVRARSGEELDAVRSKFPFGRIGQPEDIGALIAFLASDEGSYVSGQVIQVHGGGFERHSVL